MNDRQLYAEILGIEKPWSVSSVALSHEQRAVEVEVATNAKKLPCPECGKPSGRYDSRRRRWRHLDTCHLQTILVCDVPRIDCEDHGVRVTQVPWAEPGSKFTAMFESVVIFWLQHAAVDAVATELGLGWSQVKLIMNRAVARGLERRGPVTPRRIGVDETSFRKRHDYVTVVTDVDTSEVVHVAESRREGAFSSFLKSLDESALTAIESVAMDMHQAYINAARKHVPDADAKICLDRYHVAALLSRAVDRVRRQENKELWKFGDSSLSRTRYIWLSSPDNLSNTQWIQLQTLRSSSTRTARAYALKEEARSEFLWSHLEISEMGWKRWLAWACRSKLRPFVKVSKTIRRHLDGILNAVQHGISNAVAESTNATIQRIKKRACGFRSREAFRTAILFHCGGLDLHPAGSTHTN